MHYINAQKYIYGSFEMKLLALTCVSSNDKVVYLHMRHQYHYFKAAGNEYYEALESIATATGMSKATVVRCINKLEEIKWLTKHTTRNNIGHNQTTYTVHNWKEETNK